MPHGTGQEQVGRDRQPHQRRPDRGQQREKGHHHGHSNARRRRGTRTQGRQRALDGRHEQIALDRRADHRNEFLDELLHLFARQRDRPPHREHHVVAVTDQEEREVEGDEQRSHELEGALTDGERLRRDELGRLCQRGDNPALDGFEVDQAETVK